MKIVGIGTDIEKVASFRKRGKISKRVVSRVFSESERKYCESSVRSAERFAARFCAKEALVKAAPSAYPLLISDMQIEVTKDRKPKLILWSKRSVAKRFFRNHRVYVSLSHTREYAMAFVVVVQVRRE